MFKKIIICIILISFNWAADTITGDGTPVDYTKVALSARYWGMGKVGSAFSDDSGGILLNPAGLGRMHSMELSSMSTNLLGEFNYTMLNFVYPNGGETFGASLLYEDAGRIYEATTLDQYGHPEKGDKIENYNRVFTFAYGRQAFLDNLYVGGSLKYLQKKLSFVYANSASLDLGAIYKWDKELSFGLTVKNAVQQGLSYSNGAAGLDHFNTEYILGAAWSLFDKDLTLGLDCYMGAVSKVNVGAEYWWEKMVAMRAGVVNGDMTLGVGFRIEDWQFDYAVHYQEAPLENEAYISVTWGDARRSELTKPVIYLLEEEDLIE